MNTPLDTIAYGTIANIQIQFELDIRPYYIVWFTNTRRIEVHADFYHIERHAQQLESNKTYNTRLECYAAAMQFYCVFEH